MSFALLGLALSGVVLAAETESATVELLNAVEPEPGILVGGQPTMETLAHAASAGYKTVVTLRPEGEIDWDEKAAVEELGMRFVSLPISGAAELDRTNAESLAELLADSELRPMMVHCGSGNRVGGLFAAKAFFLDGLNLEESLAVGRGAGMTRMEAAVRAELESAE